MITKRQLEEAPLWTIFQGEAADPSPVGWDLFWLDTVRYPPDIAAKMTELGILYEEPELDSDKEEFDEKGIPINGVDDLDAALMYLRSGGALCKVPDTAESKYWRLLVVGAGDKNCGGLSMIIESTNFLPTELIAAGKRVQVTALQSITRKTADGLFPSYGFDPVGGVQSGGKVANYPDWEQFTSLTVAIGVPCILTDFVRERFPACRWFLSGMRLYAMLEGRVVAVINDGALEAW